MLAAMAVVLIGAAMALDAIGVVADVLQRVLVAAIAELQKFVRMQDTEFAESRCFPVPQFARTYLTKP
jgi:hypothetical protein